MDTNTYVKQIVSMRSSYPPVICASPITDVLTLLNAAPDLKTNQSKLISLLGSIKLGEKYFRDDRSFITQLVNTCPAPIREAIARKVGLQSSSKDVDVYHAQIKEKKSDWILFFYALIVRSSALFLTKAGDPSKASALNSEFEALCESKLDPLTTAQACETLINKVCFEHLFENLNKKGTLSLVAIASTPIVEITEFLSLTDTKVLTFSQNIHAREVAAGRPTFGPIGLMVPSLRTYPFGMSISEVNLILASCSYIPSAWHFLWLSAYHSMWWRVKGDSYSGRVKHRTNSTIGSTYYGDWFRKDFFSQQPGGVLSLLTGFSNPSLDSVPASSSRWWMKKFRTNDGSKMDVPRFKDCPYPVSTGSLKDHVLGVKKVMISLGCLDATATDADWITYVVSGKKGNLMFRVPGFNFTGSLTSNSQREKNTIDNRDADYLASLSGKLSEIQNRYNKTNGVESSTVTIGLPVYRKLFY